MRLYEQLNVLSVSRVKEKIKGGTYDTSASALLDHLDRSVFITEHHSPNIDREYALPFRDIC